MRKINVHIVLKMDSLKPPWCNDNMIDHNIYVSIYCITHSNISIKLFIKYNNWSLLSDFQGFYIDDMCMHPNIYFSDYLYIHGCKIGSLLIIFIRICLDIKFEIKIW